MNLFLSQQWTFYEPDVDVYVIFRTTLKIVQHTKCIDWLIIYNLPHYFTHSQRQYRKRVKKNTNGFFIQLLWKKRNTVNKPFLLTMKW